jgi:hypothetical protein
LRLHHHGLDAELGELVLGGRIVQRLHGLLVKPADDIAQGRPSLLICTLLIRNRRDQ